MPYYLSHFVSSLSPTATSAHCYYEVNCSSIVCQNVLEIVEECVLPSIFGENSPCSSSVVESKDTKENGVVSRSVTPIPSRPSTPKPPNGASDQFRSGMLTIRIFSGMYPLAPYAISFYILSPSNDRPWTMPPARRSRSRCDPESAGYDKEVNFGYKWT